MPEGSLDDLIYRSIEEKLIDAHSIDQDGSNVIVIGSAIHYLSDDDAEALLARLLREGGFLSRGRPDDQIEA